MCGIVGIIGKAEAAPLLVEALKRLEYRGYDSAGIATLNGGGIDRRRAEGKIRALEQVLAGAPLTGHTGIGHTRWATHGVPSEKNAHPHSNGQVAVVHNGIIENFQELRAELLREGRVFESDTDSEVVVHLLSHYLDQGLPPEDAMQATLGRLHGAFALGVMFRDHPDMLAAARMGSPLAIGYGDGEMYLGSDALALAPLTQRISYLEEGDWAILYAEGASVRDATGEVVERPVRDTILSGALVGKGEHRHFMAKEIFEQPQVIGDTLNGMLNPVTRHLTLPPLPMALDSVERVSIVACGTSYYAGLVARNWLETVARIPVEIDIASEFRYRRPPLARHTLHLFISQSGETADTLAALRYCKAEGRPVVAVVNVPESTMAREADAILPTLAGPEIGVASTKAFTTQLVTMAALTLALAVARGAIDAKEEARLARALSEVPSKVVEVLQHDEAIRDLAQEMIVPARDVLYMGRGGSFPIALEGALKLKEISYIHAEGYAAGELKHGPIALIDDAVPVIVIAPSDGLFDKTASNVQEVVARGGRVVLITDELGEKKIGALDLRKVILPMADDFVAPILYAIPVQLLAYHTAVLKGTDVDQPRNLAKSVTVE